MIKTATFVGYADDANYYVNGDATGYDYYNTPDNKQGDMDMANADLVVELMKLKYGKDAYLASCEEETWFGTPDYGCKLKGDVCNYIIHY